MSRRESFDVAVVNALGIHARPAAEFVKVAARFRADIAVTKLGVTVNGKSIMGVLMLAAEKGSTLSIQTSGPDAHEAARALRQLIESGFGEMEGLEL